MYESQTVTQGDGFSTFHTQTINFSKYTISSQTDGKAIYTTKYNPIEPKMVEQEMSKIFSFASDNAMMLYSTAISADKIDLNLCSSTDCCLCSASLVILWDFYV